MGAPKPCLGHPSRTQAIKALRADGFSTEAIAEKIGIPIRTVHALERDAKRPRTNESVEVAHTAVLLPPWLVHALQPHAKRRDIRPGQLAYAILETVVNEGMIDSVLDDLSEAVAA